MNEIDCTKLIPQNKQTTEQIMQEAIENKHLVDSMAYQMLLDFKLEKAAKMFKLVTDEYFMLFGEGTHKPLGLLNIDELNKENNNEK